MSEAEFFDAFESVEECFLAALDEGVARLSVAVYGAAALERDWLARVRAGLVGLLGFVDDEPAWGRLVLLDSPEGGVASFARRQRVLGVLADLLGDGPADVSRERPDDLASPGAPERDLTAEFVAGGVVSAIQMSMRDGEGGPLVELAPSLMAFVVAPYLGRSAASVELHGVSPGEDQVDVVSVPASGFPVRATYRTARVLRAIAEAPHSSNREVAAAAGLKDEGQTSKLLRRLERDGLIANVGLGHVFGESNAWLLTAAGRRVAQLNSHELLPPPPRRGAHRGAGRAA